MHSSYDIKQHSTDIYKIHILIESRVAVSGVSHSYFSKRNTELVLVEWNVVFRKFILAIPGFRQDRVLRSSHELDYVYTCEQPHLASIAYTQKTTPPT